MKIFITGATGFIGRALVAHFLSKGYLITAWTRDVSRARDMLGEGVHLVPIDVSDEILRQEIESSDAVVNLAGRAIVGVRWNKNVKEEIYSSRVGLTKRLVGEMKLCSRQPKVLISASAVGYYGDRDWDELVERSSGGTGFLSDLCRDWEQAALDAEGSGTRVCTMRFGIVLGREEGILKQVTPSFQLGLGTYTGTGKQCVPWIHIDDIVLIIGLCLRNGRISGPVNCTSPNPVSSLVFSRTLGALTPAKMYIGIPSVLLGLLFGEGGNVLTNSQNALPAKLIDHGYEFEFPSLYDALWEEFNYEHVSIKEVESETAAANRDSALVPKGQYELRTNVELNALPKETFSFFSSPLNLGITTPSWMRFRIINMPVQIDKDSRISYKISLGFGILSLRWTTRILDWNPDESFTDVQEKGPYNLWFHQHRVIGTDKGTSIMEDRVIYSVPLGILGKLTHMVFIKGILIRIFNYRRKVIRQIFCSEEIRRQ